MQTSNVLIICLSRNLTVDIKTTSLKGMKVWLSKLKQQYITNHVSNHSPLREIKAKIETNILKPEWIGHHRFGIFDLLNYVMNGNKYVYNPYQNEKFFNPYAIPSITSLHIYDYLLKNDFSPINIDNYEAHRTKFKYYLKRQPMAVIVSATYFEKTTAIEEVISFVRKINKTVPIVIGGSILLSKLTSQEKLKEEYERLLKKGIYIVIDEYGLDQLKSLLNSLAHEMSIESIPNLAYSYNGAVKYTKKVKTDYDINNSGPDWPSLAGIARNVAFIRGSRGCLNKCKFCTFPKATPKFRERSIESIRDELRKVKQARITNVAFTDDHFATNKHRIKQICSMLLKENFHFNWFAGIRATSITEENAKLLKESGCKVLNVGLESGDDRLLKMMNKGTTSQINMKCLEILHRNDILVYGTFLLGFPGETRDTINNTISWINSSPLELYKVFPFYLLPGSVVYEEQFYHKITFFGNEYDYCLWKTPSLDALQASDLLRDFILRVNKAALIYSYSPMYAFFPFLTKGYSVREALRFFQTRTELIKNELSNANYFSKRIYRKKVYSKIGNLLRHS